MADAGFRALLGLPTDDASGALQRRAAQDPALAAFLAGDGPDALRLDPDGGGPACEISRTSCEQGHLVRASPAEGGLRGPTLELAMQAVSLTRLAGSLAHEIKNPLNAMALQLALLGDKIGSASDLLGAACAGNLASLRNQIGRIDEVVRRYVEIADPSPAASFDAGGLLADVVSLFGHEARRRRITLGCDAAGTVRAAGEQARAARLLVGLVWRAIAGTPEGSRLDARASSSAREVALAVEHEAGAPDATLAWVVEVVTAGAQEMGGRLDESTHDGRMRAELVLPKERPL